MKHNLLRSLALVAALSATVLRGAPLAETTAVHAKPDASTPPITYLKAGTEPNAASSGLATTPAGWMAIELPGPFQGFVEKKDMTKALDVKAGTPIRVAPKSDAAVLTIAEQGDKTSITGIQGRWTQITLEKNIVGYIRVAAAPGYLPPIATAPAGSALPSANSAGAAIPYSAPSVTTPGQAVVSSGAVDPASTLPRQFAGKFVSTRSKLRPRRPYDWELVDNAGKRFAYLDVSKLLLTEQIDKYAGHFVVVFGAARPTADKKDIVIQIESLQLELR